MLRRKGVRQTWEGHPSSLENSAQREMPEAAARFTRLSRSRQTRTAILGLFRQVTTQIRTDASEKDGVAPFSI
jgi:hypothetical protein